MEKILHIEVLLVMLLSMTGASHAVALQSETKSMSFEDCQAAKDQLIASLRVVSPQEDVFPIVDHSNLTITRVCTAEDVVVITCLKETHQMITARSPHSANSGCLE